MKIKDRAEYQNKPKPLTLLADTPILQAIKMMSERNYGSVIVVDDDDKVSGIVTERDLMTRLLNKGKDPASTSVRDIMTTEVRMAKEDDLVLDWLRIMSNERFRHLPVVNNEGQILSMMSQGDFVSYTWPELLTRVKEKTKESLSAGYQIALIVSALLIYSIVVNFIN